MLAVQLMRSSHSAITLVNMYTRKSPWSTPFDDWKRENQRVLVSTKLLLQQSLQARFGGAGLSVATAMEQEDPSVKKASLLLLMCLSWV